MEYKVMRKSGLFPKHLMERTGLIREIGKTRTKIEIEYDPVTDQGFINVYQFVPAEIYSSGKWMTDREQQLIKDQDEIIKNYLGNNHEEQ